MMSPSVARRTIATPVLLGLLLIAFALVAVAVGSKPFNQTVIDIFLKVIFVVGAANGRSSSAARRCAL